MLRGLYTAYTGMAAEQQRLDTISNNLANVNTTAFKQDNMLFESFEDVYMKKINDPEKAGNERIGTVSLGVRPGQIFTNYEQGALELTGDQLNVAIEGDGMIAIGISDAEGNLTEEYTRDGTFLLNSQRQLVTKEGHFVMGVNGPISIDGRNVSINETGDVYVDNEYVDQIKLVDFEDYETLLKSGSGLYTTSETTAFKDFSANLVQGYVENSNVNSVKGMIEMITINRSFESNQKVMSTYDAILDKAVNSIGKL